MAVLSFADAWAWYMGISLPATVIAIWLCSRFVPISISGTGQSFKKTLDQ